MTALVPVGRTAPARTELMPRPPDEALSAALVDAGASDHRRMTAADLMTRLPSTVHHGDSMWTAWDLLQRTKLRHLVVVDDHRRPLGVLDDRTLALEWPSGLLGAHRTPVHTLLRGRARPRVRGGDDVGAVARIMLGAGADAVPVVDREGRLFGLITLWHFAELAADAGAESPSAAPVAGPTYEG